MTHRRAFFAALGTGAVAMLSPGVAKAWWRRRCGGSGFGGFGGRRFGWGGGGYYAGGSYGGYGPYAYGYGSPMYGQPMYPQGGAYPPAPGTQMAYRANYGPPPPALAPLTEQYLRSMIPSAWGAPNSRTWGTDNPSIRVLANDANAKVVEVTADWRPPNARDCVLKAGSILALHSDGLGVFDAQTMSTGTGAVHGWHQAFNFRDSSDRDMAIGAAVSFLDNLHVVGGFDGPAMNQANMVYPWGPRTFDFDPGLFASIDITKTKWLASC